MGRSISSPQIHGSIKFWFLHEVEQPGRGWTFFEIFRSSKCVHADGRCTEAQTQPLLACGGLLWQQALTRRLRATLSRNRARVKMLLQVIFLFLLMNIAKQAPTKSLDSQVNLSKVVSNHMPISWNEIKARSLAFSTEAEHVAFLFVLHQKHVLKE